MSPRLRVLFFGLIAAALFLLPLMPEVLGARRLVFRDAQITHWPWRRVAMKGWEERRVPFINATASGGEPMLANPNAALLYPTVLLEAILPAAAAFNLHYLLHVLWALWGAWALARRLNLSPGPAFVAGIAYAFSGMMLSYASAFLNSAAAAAWLPWCAAAALDVARADDARSSVRSVAAASLAFGMQLLAGEPAISLLTLLFAGGLSVAAALSEPGRRASRAAFLAAGGLGAAAFGAAIAAPLLLPLNAVFPLTYRGQHLYSERAFGASPFTASRVIEWFFPRFSGDPGALGAEGHWQYALHQGDLVYIWCVALGVVPILLIATAALSRDFWNARVAGLVSGAVLSLLFAFGSVLPFYRALFSVALLRRLRYPIKFYLLTTLCVALLAGFAAEHWRKRRGGRRHLALLAATALLYAAAIWAARPAGALDRVVAPLLEGLHAPAEKLLAAIRDSFRGDALLGVLAVGVVATKIWPRRRTYGDGYLLAIAILVLALPWGFRLFVSAEEKTLERPPALLSSLTGPGRLYVAPSLPEFNVLLSGSAHPNMPDRVSKFARIQIEELIPATGSTFAVSYLFDSDPDGSYGYYNRIANEVLTASPDANAARILRAFGARWVLEDEKERLPSIRPVTGFVIAGRRLVLSRIDDPVAELRWAGRDWRRASLSGALELVRSESFEPSTDVVLPGRAERDAAPGLSAAKLSGARVEPDRASIDVDAAGDGHLVFSRTFFDAWKGLVDGTHATVFIANGRDLAMAVGQGKHHVEFQYDTAPFVRGVALQAVALVLLAFAAIRSSSPRRGVSLAPSAPSPSGRGDRDRSDAS
jgi:hypothetical protein